MSVMGKAWRSIRYVHSENQEDDLYQSLSSDS